MFGGGRGPMGGGGGMLRAASRAVTRAGVGNLQEPFSSSSSSSSTNVTASNNASHGSGTATNSRQTQKLISCGSNNLTISASGSPINFPVAANSGVPGFSGGAFGPANLGVYDELDWVSVDGSDDEYVLGPVPSVDEVQDAVSALQQVFDASCYSHLVRDKFEFNINKDATDKIPSPTRTVHDVASVGSELDWMEPSIQICNPRMLQRRGYERVYDACHLLRTEPSVQRMVISLSSDKAVWDAVMNNEVVREIRESYNAGLTEAEKDSTESSDETSEKTNQVTNFIRWVLDNTKAKAVEVFEKVTKLVTEFFKIPDDERSKEGKHDPFEEKLRTSVLLSIVVLLVVVVTRASRA